MGIVELTPLILGLGGLYARMRNNGKKLDVIHVLVNSRLEQALEHIAKLEAALEEHASKKLVEDIQEETK